MSIRSIDSFKRKSLILNSLKILLKKYSSVRDLFEDINNFWKDEEEYLTYWQFRRYLNESTMIPAEKEDLFLRYLYSHFDISKNIINPNSKFNFEENSIRIDLTEVYAHPIQLSVIAFHVVLRNHLLNKFDFILTHPEAVPIAIAFSDILNIPWYSLSFRKMDFLEHKDVKEYHYVVEGELIRTAYFQSKDSFHQKKCFIVTDYIMKAKFIDILLDIATENRAKVNYLFAILGFGKNWKRFETELEGNLNVLSFH